MRDYKFKPGIFVFINDKVNVYLRKYPTLPKEMAFYINKRVQLNDYIEEIHPPFGKPSWRIVNSDIIFPEDCLSFIPYNNLYKQIVFKREEVVDTLNVYQLIDVLKNNLACIEGLDVIKWALDQFKTENVTFDEIINQLQSFDKKTWFNWFFENYRRQHPEKIYYEDCLFKIDNDNHIIHFINKETIFQLINIDNNNYIWKNFISSYIIGAMISTDLKTALEKKKEHGILYYFEDFDKVINWYNSL